MIKIIPAIIFSIASNLDNILLGISFGINKIKIKETIILLISFFTTIFTFLTIYLGNFLCNHFLDLKLTKYIGGFFLIYLGISSLIKHFFESKDCELESINSKIKLIEENNKISKKDLFYLILILSSNNISVGLASSVSNISVFLVVFFCFIFSFIFLLIGNIIGIKFNKCTFIQKYCNIISYIFFFILGILFIV